MAKPDQTRMLAYVETCDDDVKLRQIIVNARERGGFALADAAFRKLIDLAPEEEPGTIEHDFWRSMLAFEQVLSEESGKATRLSYARQKARKVGVVSMLSDWTAAKKPSPGFERLIERGMADLSGEAVVLRHPDHFEPEVVAAARARLEAAEVDVAAAIAGPAKPEPVDSQKGDPQKGDSEKEESPQDEPARAEAAKAEAGASPAAEA